jgi:DNA repair protein RadA/Sms
MSEVDRVLGGGILPGSMILLGGNPGIGKSTLALQMVPGIGQATLYVSAEESEDQVAMRARRLKIDSPTLHLSGENSLAAIRDQISLVKPSLVIIDSIQTVFSDEIDALPGSVSQIRETGQQLLQLSKQRDIAVLVIGHVTKEGVIAGPKMLEHMVDTVLYLEGEDRYDHRILRATKNRFGPTNEVGIFRMEPEGLQEIKNPSEMFLAERVETAAGTAIFPSLEGTRPILVEVQALVSNANFGTPQRNVNGIDYRRLAMLLAVLEKRLGLPMGTRDVFVNLVGGLRINDPAVDLAVICALVSSTRDKPLPPEVVLVGEVGLAGEVRSVGRLRERVQEAQALGFKRIVAPKLNIDKIKPKPRGLTLTPVKTVREAIQILF